MRLDSARRSLLGQEASSEAERTRTTTATATATATSRSRGSIGSTEGSVKRFNSTKSAFITRSNNPLSQQSNNLRNRKSAKSTVTDQPETEANPKIPDYLAFVFNILWLPFAAVLKVYSAARYVLGLPRKALDWSAEIAKNLAEKAGYLLLVVPYNVYGNLKLYSEKALNHVVALGLFLVCVWYFPETMTYPLFALLRLILGTLYPAYSSYKAVRTKNVREYVSKKIRFLCTNR